jgi:hypothetical protein
MLYVASHDFCKVKTVYSISIIFSKFVFHFIVATFKFGDINLTKQNKNYFVQLDVHRLLKTHKHFLCPKTLLPVSVLLPYSVRPCQDTHC